MAALATSPIATTATTRNGSGKFACPECHQATWSSQNGLTYHRRTKHGITGIAQAAPRKPHGKHIPTSALRRVNGFLRCPECQDFRTKRPQLMGRHRQAKHGITGVAPTSVKNRLIRRSKHHKETTNHVQPATPTVSAEASAQQFEVERHICFLAGSTYKEIQIYAESHGVPGAFLAEGVATFLRIPARGRQLGTVHQLPALRGQATS